MDHMVITPVWAKGIIPKKRDGNEDTSPRRFRWEIFAGAAKTTLPPSKSRTTGGRLPDRDVIECLKRLESGDELYCSPLKAL
jgi:hypothetical protein